MLKKINDLILFISIFAFLFSAGCSQQDDKSNAAAKTVSSDFKNKPIADFQDKLLDSAFQTASAIPVNPHIKDRSKAQEKVIQAALQLGQPAKALKFINIIDNWRKGSAYADLAFYCAQNNYPEKVQGYLDQAEEISRTTEDWRKDQIRVKIAQVHAFMGKDSLAGEFEKDVIESEAGKVLGVQAMISDEDSFAKNVKALDALIATGTFDSMNNALKSYVQLYNRFYSDQEKKQAIEEKIKTSSVKLPPFIQIELLGDLAGYAILHQDITHAQDLAIQAKNLKDNFQWPLEFGTKLEAKLVELFANTDDLKKAKEHADAALEKFNKEKEQLVNIYRAQALYPLAAAYKAIDQDAIALEVYKLAIQESLDNPNSRPRAEDLTAACISLALNSLCPDEQLWQKIEQIKIGLSDPW